jgi:hypothetical protein
MVVRHGISLPAILRRPSAHAGVIPEFSKKSACRIAIAKCRAATQPLKNKAPPLAEPYLSELIYEYAVSLKSAAEEQP